ncbi:MAG: ATP synthase subunit C [Candidatus Bathyarchaeota archaeon]
MSLKLNLMLALTLVSIMLGACYSLTYAEAAEAEQAEHSSAELGYIAIGAGIAISIPGFAAAWSLGTATSAIAAAGAERPEIIGRFFIYVVFIEAIAIYALIVAIFIITMLPAYL